MRRISWFGLLGLTIAIVAGCAKPAGDSGTQQQSGSNQDDATQVVQAGNITILGTRTDLTDRARAKQNVEDTLASHKDIGCLVGLWSYNGPAILSAVKDAGLEGKVPIVCFDEEDDTLQGVLDGHIHATVVQQPFEFGYRSVKVLAALAQGDKSVIPPSKNIIVPVQVIRKENARAFWDNLKKLRAEADRPAPAGDGKIKLAFVTNNPSDFWKIAHAGVRKAEAELGISVEFLTPTEGVADQQRMVEALIAKRISGMAISPNDPENQVEMINRACEVMNVICHDSDAPKSNRLCYIGTHNYLAGREAGKLIREVLPNGGKIMLFVGRIDAQNAKERRQGIIDELKGTPIPEEVKALGG